jgi:hypothetical protein
MFVPPAMAEEGGFRLPSLNPFKSEKKRAAARVSDERSSMFSLPSLPKPSMPALPSFGKSRSAPRRGQPSMISKVSDGTKGFFHKTYDVLTPWDNDKQKPPTHMGGRKKPSRSSKKESWFGWFGDEEEDYRIESVNEFLSLPRPTP